MADQSRPVSRINKYTVESGTIADSTTNQAVTLTDGLDDIYDVYVENNGTGDISIKFQSSSSDSFVLSAGSSISVNNVNIDNIYLSNSSGAGQAYRVMCWGT